MRLTPPHAKNPLFRKQHCTRYIWKAYLAAVFTVSPNNWNRARSPLKTPAVTGPECIPIIWLPQMQGLWWVLKVISWIIIALSTNFGRLYIEADHVTYPLAWPTTLSHYPKQEPTLPAPPSNNVIGLLRIWPLLWRDHCGWLVSRTQRHNSPWYNITW